jgi:pyridoxamine 5'-phosphate oxidase
VDEALRQHIQKLREDFSKGTLGENDALQDPGEQFRVWMQQAVEAQIIELQAMTLATVSAEGRPSSRVVYLREFGDNTYTFYTNYGSKKAKELAANPNAALTFFWPHLERQIRIEGEVKKSGDAASDAYFLNRPYESQVGAWASPQSGELASREELEKKVQLMKEKIPQGSMSRPAFWGGLTLTATYYEFWQGRKSRLHDRLSYHLEDNRWRIRRLAP